MGPRPSKQHTIERLDVNGHYEPENCVWATKKDQARNRRNTIFIQWKGKQTKLVDLCDELDKPASVVRSRLRLGWTIEQAMTMGRQDYFELREKERRQRALAKMRQLIEEMERERA